MLFRSNKINTSETIMNINKALFKYVDERRYYTNCREKAYCFNKYLKNVFTNEKLKYCLESLRGFQLVAVPDWQTYIKSFIEISPNFCKEIKKIEFYKTSVKDAFYKQVLTDIEQNNIPSELDEFVQLCHVSILIDEFRYCLANGKMEKPSKEQMELLVNIDPSCFSRTEDLFSLLLAIKNFSNNEYATDETNQYLCKQIGRASCRERALRLV